ncbi:MAG TPA: radical SAM protein [Candidatus Omnitrophota bacterium]|nr:radical SAM protein [Candidatus Omnitrophota bacterium]
MKHYTIPFFIPHRGCPHKCVFCDQRSITGENAAEGTSPEDVAAKIKTYLATIPWELSHVEVGFFGGSFTGIPYAEQRSLLASAWEFMRSGKIKGIRLSTRPDLIDGEKLDILLSGGVTRVELGVQSMDGDVLEAARRGHSPEDVEFSSRLIIRSGLALTHQIMLGLQRSTYEKELLTARKAVDLGATEARIYPVVVVKGTELAARWERGEYEPLGMEEALERAARLICFLEEAGVKVIRCGLHASEGLLSGGQLLAGPFHSAFGHFAREKAKKAAESAG